MVNAVTSNLNKILKPKREKYNILTVPTHEGYQTMLDKTGHNFYMIQGEGLKGWDFHTRELPPNHYLYGLPYQNVRQGERFDIVLCQNRVQQFDILANFAQRMAIPMIVLDHTEVPPGVEPNQMPALLARTGDINVFITEHNKMSWGNLAGQIVPHGIDTDVFQGYNPQFNAGISVVNGFPQRDIFCGWTQWNQIKSKGVEIDLVGENPGLSQSISDPEKLAQKLSAYRYFVNTSQYSPIPLSLMEAMSVGLPIVTTSKQEIPKIIKHEYNGLISNDIDELAGFCKRLEEDHDLAVELGKNARQTIINNYSISKFCERWNEIFDEAYAIRKK